MPKVIFVPSSGGNSQSAFYQSVGLKLQKNDFEVFWFDISQKNLLSYSAWQKPLEGIKNKIDSETYIVSHSNGTFAVSRFLSDNDINIKSWHIVASAFDPQIINSKSGDFAIIQAKNLLNETPQNSIDWVKINQSCESIILHYSKDDLVVSFDQWQKFRQKFPESIIQKYSNYGHFGISDFSELSKFIINQEKNSWTNIENQKYRIKLISKENLPLKLPEIEDYQPSKDGKSPLSKVDWINLKDQNNQIIGKRESDTMPNWAGSSWYYLRYTDPQNSEAFASDENLKYWLPVDHYFGGNEHTTMHLLYSRFWHRFLYEQGFVPTPEPYQKRTNGGILLGTDGQKMSKSKGNVINPKEKLEECGADALRLYIAFIGPYDGTVVWQDGGLKACKRLVDNIFELSKKVEKIPQKSNFQNNQKLELKSELQIELEIQEELQIELEIQEELQKIELEAKKQDLQIIVDAVIVNSQNQIFVQKRNSDRKFYPNCWDLAGGHLQKNETILECLKREVKEETSWNLSKIKKIINKNSNSTVLKLALEVEVQGNLQNPKLEKTKVSEFLWLNSNSLQILKENIKEEDSWIYETAKTFFENLNLVNSKKKYLIFDFDGVFGDTYDAWVKAQAQFLNISLYEAKKIVTNHTSKPQHSNKNNLSENDLNKKILEFYKILEIMKTFDYSLFHGFIEEVKKIPNIQMAVVSSGSREIIIKPLLQKENLIFTHILGLEDHHSKEYKIEQICRDWNINIKEIYYFTDTRSDILELQDCMDKTKIIGCSWGWEGEKKLLELLPKNQVLNNFGDVHKIFVSTKDNLKESSIKNKKLLSNYHKFIRNLTTQIQEIRNNVGVAEIMIFVNLLKEEKLIPFEIWQGFLKAIAPFAPHISEELWYQLHNFDQNDISKSIHLESWPEFDLDLCIEEEVKIAVQINGKLRGTFVSKKDEKEEILIKKAKQIASKWLENKNIIFTKTIPNKIISLVVK
jgi:predicted alpha/beta hydrolase family esterase/ADP-ribose pyrophosphatase YjhB (NUDIX family)